MGYSVAISHRCDSPLYNYLAYLLAVFKKERFYVPYVPYGHNAVFDLYPAQKV